MASESVKTVFVAMGANLSLAVAKAIIGLLVGSQALLAEAAHSLSDTMNEVFLFFSLTFGTRRADEDHPFGYGQERFFWAFMAAVFIFVAGASYSIFEGVSALVSSAERTLGDLGAAYVVLAVAFVAEGVSFSRALYQARQESGAGTLDALRRVRRSREPTVKTILFEDGAALTGIVIATAGLLLVQTTGRAYWDSIASILIGVLLAYVAVTLGRDLRHQLVGQAADPHIRTRLMSVVAGHPGVDTVLELLTMHVGPDALLVAVRMDLDDSLSGRQVEELSNELDAALRDAVPMVHEVFLDATPRPGKAPLADPPAASRDGS